MKIWWLNSRFFSFDHLFCLLKKNLSMSLFPTIHTNYIYNTYIWHIYIIYIWYIYICIHVPLGQRVMSRCAWVVVSFSHEGKAKTFCHGERRVCEKEREKVRGRGRKWKGGECVWGTEREWGWMIQIDSVRSFKSILLPNFFFSLLTLPLLLHSF